MSEERNEARVLIAENRPSSAETLKFHVERSPLKPDVHLNIVVETSFESAEQRAKEGKWDLAVVDVRLRDDHNEGDLSGLELMKTLLETDSARPPKVIVISSFHDAIVGGVPVSLLAIDRGAYTFVPRGDESRNWADMLRYAVGLALNKSAGK
jgi:CheY-like chemotaxis protein